MKKIFITALVLTASLGVYAQSNAAADAIGFADDSIVVDLNKACTWSAAKVCDLAEFGLAVKITGTGTGTAGFY